MEWQIFGLVWSFTVQLWVRFKLLFGLLNTFSLWLEILIAFWVCVLLSASHIEWKHLNIIQSRRQFWELSVVGQGLLDCSTQVYEKWNCRITGSSSICLAFDSPFRSSIMSKKTSLQNIFEETCMACRIWKQISHAFSVEGCLHTVCRQSVLVRFTWNRLLCLLMRDQSSLAMKLQWRLYHLEHRQCTLVSM